MPVISDLVSWLLRIVFGTSVYSQGFNPDEDKQHLFYANHSSHLDALLIWAALPAAARFKTRPVAALDYWGLNRLRKFVACKLFQAVLIDRQRSGADNPLASVSQALEKGSSIIFFPEGSRSMDGHLQDFKSGIYYLAKDHSQLHLTPVYLHNLNRILPKGELLPVPLLSQVIFGTPFKLEPKESKDQLLERARELLLNLAP